MTKIVINQMATCNDPVCVKCQRNEILMNDICVCPDSKIHCGEVTPFYNVIITAACIITTAAIVIHVFHEIYIRHYNKPHRVHPHPQDSFEVRQLMAAAAEKATNPLLPQLPIDGPPIKFRLSRRRNSGI